jgi:hypothetical protein
MVDDACRAIDTPASDLVCNIGGAYAVPPGVAV